MMKIHAVDAHHEGERDENRCDHREYTHNFIKALTGGGEIDIDHARCHFPIILDKIKDLNGVIVTIAQIYYGAVIYQSVIVSQQMIDDFAVRP